MKHDPAWELAIMRVQRAKGGAPNELAAKRSPATFRDFWLGQTLGGGGSLPNPRDSVSELSHDSMANDMKMPKFKISLPTMRPRMPRMGKMWR